MGSSKDFFTGILQRLGRDFIWLGVVFAALYLLVMLHLTKTIDIAPLNFLLDARSQSQESKGKSANVAQDKIQVPVFKDKEDERHPNLLP